MTTSSHSNGTGEHIDDNEQEQYINSADILAEVPDDGDLPMDDDEDDGELGAGGEVVMEDNSIRHFPGHKGSVFAVSAHPTQPIIASGGEDDVGFLWDLNTGEAFLTLTGHTDSVASVAFNHDGEYLATGGMDGKVRIWDRENKEDWKSWKFFTELQGPDEVMWLRWHPRGNVLLAGSNDGMVWLWQLPSGNTMQVLAGHTGSVQCGEFTPDGKRIVTADEEGTLIVWDPRSPTPIFKVTASDARFELDGITSLAVNSSSTLVVVGGVSGGVRVVSLSKGDIVGALDGHKEDESVESVRFIDLTGPGAGSGVVVTGGTDGRACIWDLSTMRLRTTLEHEDAITSLVVHPYPKNHLLTSGSADRTLRTWDARTGTLLREYKGHQEPVLAATLALNGTRVVSAGDDGVCLVFESE